VANDEKPVAMFVSDNFHPNQLLQGIPDFSDYNTTLYTHWGNLFVPGTLPRRLPFKLVSRHLINSAKHSLDQGPTDGRCAMVHRTLDQATAVRISIFAFSGQDKSVANKLLCTI
jgi:hypothetical protein